MNVHPANASSLPPTPAPTVGLALAGASPATHNPTTSAPTIRSLLLRTMASFVFDCSLDSREMPAFLLVR
jgi:hypothetical protein